MLHNLTTQPYISELLSEIEPNLYSCTLPSIILSQYFCSENPSYSSEFLVLLFVDKILRGLSEGMKSLDYSHREVYVRSGL